MSEPGDVITLRIYPAENRAEPLERTGWRDLQSPDWIEVPGGNFISINAEHSWLCRVQGFAAGVGACFAGIAVLALAYSSVTVGLP